MTDLASISKAKLPSAYNQSPGRTLAFGYRSFPAAFSRFSLHFCISNFPRPPPAVGPWAALSGAGTWTMGRGWARGRSEQLVLRGPFLFVFFVYVWFFFVGEGGGGGDV